MGESGRVKVILRAGADPERADSEGVTPLCLASVNGEAEMARLLLVSGASQDTESGGLGRPARMPEQSPSSSLRGKSGRGPG
ncbi:hypothetical protein GCM10009647_053670 [Streptomyces sanglieri]